MENLRQLFEQCLQPSVRSRVFDALFGLVESFLWCGFHCHFQNYCLCLKNPSKGLDFYSAPCKNQLINMALLGIVTARNRDLGVFLVQK